MDSTLIPLNMSRFLRSPTDSFTAVTLFMLSMKEKHLTTVTQNGFLDTLGLGIELAMLPRSPSEGDDTSGILY